MLRTRVIPCLLLQGNGLVKTVRFKSPTYVGDPINAVRIFNEKEVDELILLDIDASRKQRPPNFQLISEIASECFMPLAYGGGVSNIEQIGQLFRLGVEKVSLNTAAFSNPKLVREASSRYGNQSITVTIDVKKGLFGKPGAYYYGGTKKSGYTPVDAALKMEDQGAGELLVNSINRDGTFSGYDLETLAEISSSVEIPVIALGGAARIEHFSEAITQGHADAVAAGSMFVFHGKHRAVLISYPSINELEKALT
ncbi:MAG: AglZ/HisF2 family acetamidino modification protein [Chromatiales bacterium]